MKLELATDVDDGQLKSFFERMILPGAIDFSIQRHGSFFDHYKLLSDDYETLILKDDHGLIHGVASLVFREGYVLGEKQTWGFATDLRIAPTRKAIAQWAQYFMPVLERAREERRCRYIFSAVEQHDNQAYNALIRPTSHTRRRLPRYLLANKFSLVGLHGRVLFSAKPLLSIRLKPLDDNDLPALCEFIRERALLRPLATIYTPESFKAEIARWPNMRMSDFRIARDTKGNVRGLAGLYDARPVQSVVPTAYNGFAGTLAQTLKLASWMRLARPLPEVGQQMPVRYLTHLHCDTAEVFHRLADDAFSRLAPREILAYLHFRGNWRTLPPNSFIASALPFGLYMILPPNGEAPPWPIPSVRSLPPDFDPAWL